MKESAQGHRSDLEEAVEMIENGSSMLEIAQEAPTTFVRNFNGLARLACSLFEPTFMPQKRIHWYLGPTGSGKTRMAMQEAKALHGVFYKAVLTDRSKPFFDGYCGQKALILDDYRMQFEFPFLLLLLDKYSMLVEVKGSMVPMIAEGIWVTSAYEPQVCYANYSPTDILQLMRRIDEIIKFG